MPEFEPTTGIEMVGPSEPVFSVHEADLYKDLPRFRRLCKAYVETGDDCPTDMGLDSLPDVIDFTERHLAFIVQEIPRITIRRA